MLRARKTAEVLRPMDFSFFRQLGDKVYALMDQLRQHQAALTVGGEEGEGICSGSVAPWQTSDA